LRRLRADFVSATSRGRSIFSARTFLIATSAHANADQASP